MVKKRTLKKKGGALQMSQECELSSDDKCLFNLEVPNQKNTSKTHSYYCSFYPLFVIYINEDSPLKTQLDDYFQSDISKKEVVTLEEMIGQQCGLKTHINGHIEFTKSKKEKVALLTHTFKFTGPQSNAIITFNVDEFEIYKVSETNNSLKLIGNGNKIFSFDKKDALVYSDTRGQYIYIIELKKIQGNQEIDDLKTDIIIYIKDESINENINKLRVTSDTTQDINYNINGKKYSLSIHNKNMHINYDFEFKENGNIINYNQTSLINKEYLLVY